MAENRELALVLKLVADQFQSELRNSQGALASFNNFIKEWRTQLATAGQEGADMRGEWRSCRCGATLSSTLLSVLRTAHAQVAVGLCSGAGVGQLVARAWR